MFEIGLGLGLMFAGSVGLALNSKFIRKNNGFLFDLMQENAMLRKGDGIKPSNGTVSMPDSVDIEELKAVAFRNNITIRAWDDENKELERFIEYTLGGFDAIVELD